MNRVLYPNGVDLDLKRDKRGRITEIAFTRSGVYLDGEMRRLDAVGNTTTRERSGEDELRFGYDTLDQLLQVAAGMSVQEVYAYDAVGNWSVDGRRHDACNRLTRDNTRTFDYDRDGNLTEIHDSGGDGSAFYEYDALGRLVSATLSSGETITYRYDAIGRRYAVSTGAGTTFTLFDGWQEIGTVEPDGSGRAMLSVGEFRLAADTASGPMYVHAGLEGSVIALTNVMGELVEKYRYTAFGLLTVLDAEGEEKGGEALSPWLYHGRLFEEASGLYWMRMRHYSPDLGRFLQPDPAGIAGGINLYSYSNNNPLRYFDPWGLWPAPDATGSSDGEHGESILGMCVELDRSEIEKLLRRLAIIGDDGEERALKGHKYQVERRISDGYYEKYIIATGLENAIDQLEELGVRWDQIDFWGHGNDATQSLGTSGHLYPDQFGAFRPYLNEGAQIFLHGCDVACGPDAEYYVQRIADYSRATVTGYKGEYDYICNKRRYSLFDWFGPKSITRSPQPGYDPMEPL